MRDCCELILQYFIFILNLIFASAGLVLIAVGAYIQIVAKQYLEFLSDSYLNTPIFIIVAGVVVFVIAFFGCLGACKENPYIIYIYAFFLCVILIGEVAAGIAALILKGSLKEVIDAKMYDGMQYYGKHDHEGVTKAWDLVQHELHCCGSYNYTDWESVHLEEKVPQSCCINDTDKEDCGRDRDNIYEIGCLKMFEEEFVDNLGLVGAVTVGVFLVQLLVVVLGLIFSWCLTSRISTIRRTDENKMFRRQKNYHSVNDRDTYHAVNDKDYN